MRSIRRCRDGAERPGESPHVESGKERERENVNKLECTHYTLLNMSAEFAFGLDM